MFIIRNEARVHVFFITVKNKIVDIPSSVATAIRENRRVKLGEMDSKC